MKSLIEQLLSGETEFHIRRVYAYTTWPGYPLCAARGHYGEGYSCDEEEYEEFEPALKQFVKQITSTLQKNSTMDNKIAVELEFKFERLDKHVGTIFFCYADDMVGFFLTCRPYSKRVYLLDVPFKFTPEV